MKQTKLKALLSAPALMLLLGLVSCNKEAGSPEVKQLRVVDRAVVTTSLGGGNATKADFDNTSGKFTWQAGDRIVMVSNGQINGTLTCSSNEGGFATFTGEVEQFTPESVNLYFLGNNSVSEMSPVFDFSAQSGSVAKSSSYIFFKVTGVELTTTDEENYSPKVEPTFEKITSFITMNFDVPAISGQEAGTKVKSVKIDGLDNRLCLDLATGDIRHDYMKNSLGGENVTTTINPGGAANYGTEYLLAVIPQEANDLTIRVEYVSNDGSGTTTTLWNGIDWNVAEGTNYTTDWSKQEIVPAAVSDKGGYNGSAVSGGENADGKNHKGGYNGQSVDGEVDNPTGDKSGYTGWEVY